MRVYFTLFVSIFLLMILVVFSGFVIGSSLVKDLPKQTSIGPEDWIQLRKIQKRFEKRFQIKSDSVILLVDEVKNGTKNTTRIGYCTVDWIKNTPTYRHKYIQIKKELVDKLIRSCPRIFSVS